MAFRSKTNRMIQLILYPIPILLEAVKRYIGNQKTSRRQKDKIG